MTQREVLQKVTVAKVREHADFLKHNVATWQLLARAADEIERLQAESEVFRDMLDKIAKHPDTPELIKQYARGDLHSSNPLSGNV